MASEAVELEAFSQACQMHREFLKTKLTIFTIFAAVTAGLCTLAYVQLPENYWLFQSVRVCAWVATGACAFFDWRITETLHFYESVIGKYADKLDIGDFNLPTDHLKWRSYLQYAAWAIYGITILAWGMATRPAKVQEPEKVRASGTMSLRSKDVFARLPRQKGR